MIFKYKHLNKPGERMSERMNERIEGRKQILLKTNWRTAIFTGLTCIDKINKIKDIKMFIPNKVIS